MQLLVKVGYDMSFDGQVGEPYPLDWRCDRISLQNETLILFTSGHYKVILDGNRIRSLSIEVCG